MPRRPTDREARSLDEVMASLQEQVRARRAEDQRAAAQQQEKLSRAGYTEEVVAELAAEAQEAPEAPAKRKRSRGITSTAMVQQAQLRLFEMETSGRFTSYPIDPQQEYPTFLTRIPLFMATRSRQSQLSLLDENLAIRFETPWGEGWKYGPPLTVFDEDTLIALARLRQQRLTGNPANLPIQEIAGDADGASRGAVAVDALYCTVTHVMRMCGPTTSGGNNFRARLESINRLGNVVLDLRRGGPKDLVEKGMKTPLIHVLWERVGETALLYVQFPPQMVEWLTSAYSYIDWNVRRELTDVGKAIHRFLSGQPREYQIGTEKLMTTVGYMGAKKEFNRALKKSLTTMQALGWVQHWKIVGNGRTQPHKLMIQR